MPKRVLDTACPAADPVVGQLLPGTALAAIPFDSAHRGLEFVSSFVERSTRSERWDPGDRTTPPIVTVAGTSHGTD